MRSLTTAVLAAVLAVGVSGCEADTTAPATGRSRMEVGVRGDDAQNAPSASRSPGARFSLSGGASGSVDVRARVFIEARGGEWVDVTNGFEARTVQASGGDGVQVLASTEVDAREYRRVRVEFERVQADLLGSITIGSSLLSGTVTVDSGTNGTIVVERDVAFETRAGATSRLEVNLNAGEWLQHADTETKAVAAAEFRNAVVITTH